MPLANFTPNQFGVHVFSSPSKHHIYCECQLTMLFGGLLQNTFLSATQFIYFSRLYYIDVKSLAE